MRLHLFLGLMLAMSFATPTVVRAQNTPAKTIAPALTDVNIAVVRVDLTRLNLPGIIREVKRVPNTKEFIQQIVPQYRKMVEPLLEKGVKEVYLLINMAPRNDDSFVIAIPVTNTNAQAVTKHGKNVLMAPATKRIGNLVLFGGEGLQNMDKLPKSNNPNLAKAFASVADADVQVVVAPSKFLREKILPQVPDSFPMGLLPGNPSAMLGASEWAAVGANLKAPVSIEAKVTFSDAGSAKQVADLQKSVIKLAKMAAQNGEEDWSGILNIPELKAVGKQVVVRMDQRKILTLTNEMTKKVKKASGRMISSNNLKQLALAMHIHHDAKRKFPAQAITDANGKPLLSWRVSILPYIEQQELYKQFKLDEPWDSPHNKKLIARMPKTYLSPQSKAGPGKTTYLVPVGKNTIFGGAPITLSRIPDGTSNTLMIVEANDKSAVIWTKPDDLKINPANPLQGLTNTRKQFLAAFADGSVRSIPLTLPAATLNNLFQYNDGNAVNLP